MGCTLCLQDPSGTRHAGLDNIIGALRDYTNLDLKKYHNALFTGQTYELSLGADKMLLERVAGGDATNQVKPSKRLLVQGISSYNAAM